MSENETFDATKATPEYSLCSCFARETSFEQLLEMQEKLNAVIEERREEAEREAAERAERERKRRTAPVDCRRRFSPEELLGLSEDAQNTQKDVAKAPPKYQFDENGETKYWSGRPDTKTNRRSVKSWPFS